MNKDIPAITRLSMARFRLNYCLEQIQAHEKAIAKHKAALDALFDKQVDLIHEVRSLALSEKISKTLKEKEPADTNDGSTKE
jgi:phage shock protein A